MQKRANATPRTPIEQVVRTRNQDTSQQRRTGRGRGRGGTTQRRQVLPQEPAVVVGVSPYMGYFKELQTPATQPAGPSSSSIPLTSTEAPSPQGVVVAPLSVHQFPKPIAKRASFFATGYASDPEDSEEEGVKQLPPPKRVAWINVHTILLAIISVPALLGIVLCIVHFAVRPESMGLASDRVSNQIPRHALSTLLALESEMMAAASFISVVSGIQYNVSIDAATQGRRSAAVQNQFLLATQHTDESMSNLLMNYGEHVSVYNSQGLSFNANGMPTKLLDKSRRGVSSGSNPWTVLRQYKSVITTLVVYIARVQLHTIAVDKSGLEALSGLFAAGQWAASSSLNTFLSYKRDTASTGRLFRDLQDTYEMRIPWFAAGEMSFFEGYLRYPTSSVYEASSSFVDDDNLRDFVLPEAVTPTGSLVYQLLSQSLWVRPVDDWLYEVSFSAEDAADAAKDLVSTLSPLKETMSRLIENSAQQRRTTQLAILGLMLAVTFITLMAGVANAVLYLQAVPAHTSLNATVAQLNSSMCRIVSFVSSLKKLDIPTIQLYIKRSVQRGAPLEEASLYKAVGPMRDFETYLPVTVRYPPYQLPKGALGSKAGLFIRPALVHSHGYVALRLGLAEFHSVFSANGPKQKAIHSVLSRMLATLQELGDLACGASEGNTANSPFISVYGDHAVLWFNISRAISSPCLRAILVAKLLHYETSKWHGLDKSMLPMSLCAGDAVLGHVGNQLPQAGPNPTPLVSFAALGPLPEDLTLVNHVARLHQSNFIVNNAAVQGYFKEKASMGGNNNMRGRQTFHHVLSNGRLSVLGHLQDSSFIFSQGETSGYSPVGVGKILHHVDLWATKMANGADPEPWIGEFLPGDNREVMSVLAPALADLLLLSPRVKGGEGESGASGNQQRKRRGEGVANSSTCVRSVSSISPFEFETLLQGLTLHFTPVELLEVPLHNSADSGSGEHLPQPDQVLPSGQRFIDFSGVKSSQPSSDQTKNIVFPCFVQTQLSEREEAINAARVLQTYFEDAVLAALADGFVPAPGGSQGGSQDNISDDEDAAGSSPTLQANETMLSLEVEGARRVERIIASLPSPQHMERALRRANESSIIEVDAEWEVLFRQYVQLSQRMQRFEAVTLMNDLQGYGLRRYHMQSTTAARSDHRSSSTRHHPTKVIVSAPAGTNQHHISTNLPTVDRLISLLSTGLELGAIPTSATYLKKSRLLDTL